MLAEVTYSFLIDSGLFSDEKKDANESHTAVRINY